MTYRTQHLDNTPLLNWAKFLFYKLSTITYERFLQNKAKIVPVKLGNVAIYDLQTTNKELFWTKQTQLFSLTSCLLTLVCFTKQSQSTRFNRVVPASEPGSIFIKTNPNILIFKRIMNFAEKTNPFFYKTLICAICEICGFKLCKTNPIFRRLPRNYTFLLLFLGLKLGFGVTNYNFGTSLL